MPVLEKRWGERETRYGPFVKSDNPVRYLQDKNHLVYGKSMPDFRGEMFHRKEVSGLSPHRINNPIETLRSQPMHQEKAATFPPYRQAANLYKASILVDLSKAPVRQSGRAAVKVNPPTQQRFVIKEHQWQYKVRAQVPELSAAGSTFDRPVDKNERRVSFKKSVEVVKFHKDEFCSFARPAIERQRPQAVYSHDQSRQSAEARKSILKPNLKR